MKRWTIRNRRISEFSPTGTMLKKSEVYKVARDETISMTEAVLRLEKEIDERVKELYGI
jgi:hypothetical protein